MAVTAKVFHLDHISKMRLVRSASTEAQQLSDFAHIDSKAKANTLNDQFTSVFTNDDTTNILDKGPSRSPKNTTTVPGVRKLLKYRKIHKVTGLENLPECFSKSFRD